MAYTFFVDCPKCKTKVRVVEGGTHYPARSSDPIYCPVCKEIIEYRNTMYDFEVSVESLDETLEPFKSDFQKKK